MRAANLAPTLPADGVVLRLEQAVIADVLESRELLEVQAARLAAARATAGQVRLITAASREPAGTWDDNIRFHTAVAGGTGNFMLERLVRLQLELLREVHQRGHYRSAQAAARLLAEHRAIADAVAARDPDAAAAAVSRHFAHTRAAVEARWPITS